MILKRKIVYKKNCQMNSKYSLPLDFNEFHLTSVALLVCCHYVNVG